MYRIRSAALGAMSLLLVPALVHSQGKAQSQSRTTPVRRPDPIQSSPKTAAVFRDPDRTFFREYFVAQRLVVVELPPGIAKNVARGKPLPPGIARKAFPRGVVRRNDVDANVVFVMVGHNMVAMRNGVVVDVMFNVFP
jgi:hypothetical protein